MRGSKGGALINVKKREKEGSNAHGLCEKEKNPLHGKRSHNSVCGLAKLASELGISRRDGDRRAVKHLEGRY